MLPLLLALLGCRYLDQEGCDAGEAAGYSDGYDDGLAGCGEDPTPDRVDQALSGSGAYAASYEACYELFYKDGYSEGSSIAGQTDTAGDCG